jgi:hypothetical protein
MPIVAEEFLECTVTSYNVCHRKFLRLNAMSPQQQRQRKSLKTFRFQNVDVTTASDSVGCLFALVLRVSQD